MQFFLLSEINTKIVRRLDVLTILFFYIFQNFLIRNIQNSYNFSYGFNFSFVLIFLNSLKLSRTNINYFSKLFLSIIIFNLDTNENNTVIVGGVVGYNYGNIEECFVSGNIKCEGKSNAKCRAGGLAGTLSGNIKNCYNKAKINGKGKIANCR